MKLRLAIHLQHLSNHPTMYRNKFEETSIWIGSNETADERYLEAIQRQKLSYVCTTPVTHNDSSSSSQGVGDDDQEGEGTVFIVTGARLHVNKQGSRHVLHLSLLFTKLSGFVAVKSSWIQGTSESSLQKSSLLASIGSSISGSLEKESNEQLAAAIVVDSSIYPGGPQPDRTRKLLRVVDTSQVCRGPHDSPGYWLVTGAKLGLERGKICLCVEFSLLNRCP